MKSFLFTLTIWLFTIPINAQKSAVKEPIVEPKSKTEIIYLTAKDTLFNHVMNFVQVTTDRNKEKISIHCKGCSTNLYDPEKLIFRVIPPKNETGKTMVLEVKYDVKTGKNGELLYTDAETIASEKVDIVEPRKGMEPIQSNPPKNKK